MPRRVSTGALAIHKLTDVHDASLWPAGCTRSTSLCWASRFPDNLCRGALPMQRLPLTVSRETHWSCCSNGTLCVLLCPLKLPLSNCLIPEATGGLADKPQCSKRTQGQAGDMDPALPESQLESRNCCNTLSSCLIPMVQGLACRMGSGACHGHFQGLAFYVSLNYYLFY